MTPRTSLRILGTHGRRARDERGAAAVEMALVLPLLVLLVFGIVQFSIAYNQKQALHAAAREGARLGSLSASSVSDIEDQVASSLAGVTFGSTPTVSVPTGDCDGRSGENVVVEVDSSYTVDIPLFPGSATVPLQGRGQFRCE